MSNYKSLFETGRETDCELLINGKTYKLHSKIISKHSVFFETYYGNLGKMQQDPVIEILNSYGEFVNCFLHR